MSFLLPTQDSPSVRADFSGEYTHRALCLPKRHAISMASIVLLNGAAALLMLAAFALGFQSTEPKLAAAMLVFGGGAMAGLLSSLNRLSQPDCPSRGVGAN
ncbi:MAG: hypothetical protein WA441_03335 [Methyloceanibacter sp.]